MEYCLKIKKIKKITILCLLVAAFVLAACTADGGTETTVETKEPAGEQAAEDLVGDDLGEANYGGRSFTFITGGSDFWNQLDRISVEGEIGEVINDATYKRNLAVEERFNIAIKDRQVTPDRVVPDMQKSIGAGDRTYDAGYMWGCYFIDFAASGYLYDLNNLPRVDFAKPYWDQNAKEQLSILGRLYMMTGTANMFYNDCTWVLMFNKKLLADYSLEDPYKLVREGNWTIDKMLEMGKPVAKDLNGDGNFSVEDQYGLVTHSETIKYMFYASGENFFNKNADGIPELSGGGNRAINVLQKVFEVFNEYNFTFDTRNPKNQAAVAGIIGGNIDGQQAMFEPNKALFCGEQLECVRRYREMETPFGLLPLPRYDAGQKDYYSSVSYPFSGVCVPIDVGDDAEFTGTILEAMHSASYHTIIPAYFDSALYGKFFRDEESRETLDIIYGRRSYPFDEFKDFGGLVGSLKADIIAGKANFASTIASIEGKAKTAIEALIESLEKLN